MTSNKISLHQQDDGVDEGADVGDGGDVAGNPRRRHRTRARCRRQKCHLRLRFNLQDLSNVLINPLIGSY